VDLAPTFCRIADVAVPEWMQGTPLPVDDGDAARRGFERSLTEWDSELFGVAVHLRTITRAGWVLTRYLPGTVHDGSEGELYDLVEDPLQQRNRWDDPACSGIRSDLLVDLDDHLPPPRQPRLLLEAPV
jgi:arylsulfatase A-like enzyme